MIRATGILSLFVFHTTTPTTGVNEALICLDLNMIDLRITPTTATDDTEAVWGSFRSRGPDCNLCI